MNSEVKPREFVLKSTAWVIHFFRNSGDLLR